MNSKFSPQGPKYCMGAKLESSIRGNSETPGPGAYDCNSNNKSFSYSLLGKVNINGHNNEPGPGSYEHKSTVINIPSSKFGFEKRKNSIININKKIKTPGPGS